MLTLYRVSLSAVVLGGLVFWGSVVIRAGDRMADHPLALWVTALALLAVDYGMAVKAINQQLLGVMIY
jgi:hypothetical protein